MNPVSQDSLSSALKLIQGLQQRGLVAAVTSPGSRNAPLMQAFDRCGVRTVIALDERAAAHHALGMALSLQRPVAVCCTSGTAAMHHGAALAEALRTGLPLISLTADRPAGADGEWQSQTLPQEGMHAPHVRAQFSWNPGAGAFEPDLDRMEAALAHGPVHINCPFDEPLYPAPHAERASFGPEVTGVEWKGGIPSTASTSVLCDRLTRAVERGERILLLGGTQPLALPAVDLSIWADAAVVAGDTTSGLAPHGIRAIAACDRWIGAWQASGKSWSDVGPDLIVTFGAPLLSRRLRSALGQGSPDHLHIDGGGQAPRAFGVPCVNISCPVPKALHEGARILSGRAGTPSSGNPAEWRTRWWTLENALRKAHGPALAAAPWSDLKVHAMLHAALPGGWGLHLGNSTPVRYAQLWAGGEVAHPWCNRGVAGIDGCTSTAVGAALAGHPTTLITGELGFLYDANAFHVHPLPDDLRIAVVHNGGGGIFRWLDGPERTGLAETHFEWRHDTELRPLCDLHGLVHERVHDEAGLRKALQTWWDPAEAPKVLEILTGGRESAEAHRRYMEAVRA